jgi:hypothetical protein
MYTPSQKVTNLVLIAQPQAQTKTMYIETICDSMYPVTESAHRLTWHQNDITDYAYWSCANGERTHWQYPPQEHEKFLLLKNLVLGLQIYDNPRRVISAH